MIANLWLAGYYTGGAVNIDNDHAKATSFLKKLKIKNLKVVFSPQDKTNTADAYRRLVGR